MSSLLPIFVDAQNGPNAISGRGAVTEPVSQVSKDQANQSGQAFAQAFSQVLSEHGGAAAFLKHLQTLVSTRNQQDAALPVPLTLKDVRTLEKLIGPETVGRVLGKLQDHRILESPEELQLPALDSDSLLDLARLLSAQSFATPVVITNESASSEQASFGRVPTIPLSSLQGFQPSPGPVFQENRFQHAGGESTLKPVSQDSAIEGKIPGNGHIPLPKAFESSSILSQSSVPKVAELRSIPQEVSQGSVKNQGSSGTKPEESLSVRTLAQSAKDFSSGAQQLERSILGNDTRQNPILPKDSSPLARPQNVQSNHIPLVTAIPAEGPAGFAGPGLTNQIAVKSIPGNSSVLSDASGPGAEYRASVPADLLGETGLLGKGDRVQTLVETSVKSVGLDPSGGQGLGNGMNHFSNSQSGFQQPSLSSGQGVGLRTLEERGQEFPAPVLQRLQMDVQLSETQRVQIDVGVQNRQVYAGLVMDHSVLRNLANQFVPQLENQLTQVDLELQEFSAEVREEREQETQTMLDDSRSHEGEISGQTAEGELLSIQNPVGRQKEPGLHFVA